MPNSLSTAIRSRLSRYLAGEMALRAFDEWFVLATLDVERSDDPAAEALTWEIFLRLAEYSNGDCTEAELKSVLRPLGEPALAPTSHPTPS